MTDDDTLPPKQRKAIAAILSQPTIEKAAITAGISERQLHRWLESPAFKAELKAAEDELITAAGNRLTAGLLMALDALAELITDGVSESVRRAAAAEWINQAFKIQEMRNLAERIDALERMINDGR